MNGILTLHHPMKHQSNVNNSLPDVANELEFSSKKSNEAERR